MSSTELSKWSREGQTHSRWHNWRPKGIKFDANTTCLSVHYWDGYILFGVVLQSMKHLCFMFQGKLIPPNSIQSFDCQFLLSWNITKTLLFIHYANSTQQSPWARGGGDSHPPLCEVTVLTTAPSCPPTPTPQPDHTGWRTSRGKQKHQTLATSESCPCFVPQVGRSLSTQKMLQGQTATGDLSRLPASCTSDTRAHPLQPDEAQAADVRAALTPML